VRENTSLDGGQKNTLIQSLSGSRISNPVALNKLREDVLKGNIQTISGIYEAEGVSMADKRETAAFMEHLKKPENAYIKTVLGSLNKYIPNPLSKETPAYSTAVMSFYNYVSKQIEDWKDKGEDVRSLLTPNYLKEVAKSFTPSMQEMIKSLQDMMNSNTARQTMFTTYGEDFAGFVYDYFNLEKQTLKNMKARDRYTWEQLVTILKDKKARKTLRAIYDKRKNK
jgi:hypothetical protein